jgi:hypothetical protein
LESTDGGRISIGFGDPAQVSWVRGEYTLEIFAGKDQSDNQLAASKYLQNVDFKTENLDGFHGREINATSGTNTQFEIAREWLHECFKDLADSCPTGSFSPRRSRMIKGGFRPYRGLREKSTIRVA